MTWPDTYTIVVILWSSVAMYFAFRLILRGASLPWPLDPESWRRASRLPGAPRAPAIGAATDKSSRTPVRRTRRF